MFFYLPLQGEGGEAPREVAVLRYLAPLSVTGFNEARGRGVNDQSEAGGGHGDGKARADV